MITRTSPIWPLAALVISAFTTVACSKADRENAATDTAPTIRGASDTGAAALPQRVLTVEGFKTPESVRYDPADDVFFVSSINGSPSEKDNNGFISRVRADGSVDSLMFIAGGRGGITLHAPKGLALTGDIIWVTDIDVVRLFNRKTGAFVATVDLRHEGAVFLNDIATGPDSDVYVTDTGIRFKGNDVQHPGPDRIFRIDNDRKVSVAVQGDTLARPNGITWDPHEGRFIVVPFGGKNLLVWKPGEKAPTMIASGPGMFDGVEVLDDGRALVSSWVDSSIYVLESGSAEPLITGVNSPADIGVDTKRLRVAIPLFMDNRVEIWTIPRLVSPQ